jgi:hypothetical protein
MRKTIERYVKVEKEKDKKETGKNPSFNKSQKSS